MRSAHLGWLVLALCAGRAHAGERVLIDGPGTDGCPSAKAVAKLVSRLRPESEVLTTGMPSDGGALRATIEDRGAELRVATGQDERVFVDSRRDCTERARNAAVFIALGERPPPPRVAAPELADAEQSAATVVARPPRDRLVLLGADVSLLGQVAVAALSEPSQARVAGGGALRFDVGRRGPHSFFGGVLGLGGQSTIQLELGDLSARIDRLPIDLGARALARLGRWELGADLGVALSVLWVRGEGVVEARTTVRLEPGLRTAAVARLFLARWLAMEAELGLTWVPVAAELAVLSSGRVGKMPSLWVAGGIGLAAKIH